MADPEMIVHYVFETSVGEFEIDIFISQILYFPISTIKISSFCQVFGSPDTILNCLQVREMYLVMIDIMHLYIDYSIAS